MFQYEGSSENVVLQLKCIAAGPPAEQVPLRSEGNIPLPGVSSASPETVAFSSSSPGLSSNNPRAPSSLSPTSWLLQGHEEKGAPDTYRGGNIGQTKETKDRDKGEDNEEATSGRMVAGMLPGHKRMDAKF